MNADDALLRIRIIWAALLMGQLAFAAIVVVLLFAGHFQPTPELYPMLLYVVAGLFIVATPIAYFVRGQIYKANWRENSITPKGYVTGNLVLLAVLEAISFAALVAVLATGRLFPTILILLFSVVVQIINFPNGRPMQPTKPTW